MGVLTDSYTMNIQIIQHGVAKFVSGSIVYPATVDINTPFTIQYQVQNTGAVADTLYGRILAGTTECTNSAWTQTVQPNSIVSKTYNHPGISSNTTFTLETGHQ